MTRRCSIRQAARPKRHLVVDRAGRPLAARLTAATRHESLGFKALLDAIPPITQPNSRCRQWIAPPGRLPRVGHHLEERQQGGTEMADKGMLLATRRRVVVAEPA